MINSTRKGEQARTAEMFVDIAETQGVYFAFVLWYDSGRRTREEICEFMDLLKDTRGAIKKGDQL